jgi:transposase
LSSRSSTPNSRLCGTCARNSSFFGALTYIDERRVGLSVYLEDPEVSIDTNHLERALRVIPTVKKNWLLS